jgi:hypothetical protein
MTAGRAGVLLAVALLAPAPARAADSTEVASGVRVVAPACPISPVSVPDFVDSLRVELASRAHDRHEALVTLEIAPCDTATTTVQVSVQDFESRHGLAREIGLADVAPTARPRALALAVAELVRAAAPPPAPPPPVAAPASPPPPAAPPEPPASVTISGDAIASLFPGLDSNLYGARFGASLERAHLHMGLYFEDAQGDRHFADGTVDLKSRGAGVVVGPRWGLGRFTVSPGLVGTIAWANIDGHARAANVIARSGETVIMGARARFLLAWSFGATVTARLLLEGGWQVRGFEATVDGLPSAGMAGPSIVAGLGLGFGL